MIDVQNLKSVGMMQNNYMFHVNIPMIPFIGANNLEFLVRSTTIPGVDLMKDNIRFLDEQYNLPAARVISDPTWTVTVLMDETHTLLDQIVKWYYAIPENSFGPNVQSIKTDAYIKLLGLDKDNVNKRVKLLGLFILDIPDIAGLSQTGTKGHVSLNLKFAFDDVDWDPNNQLVF